MQDLVFEGRSRHDDTKPQNDPRASLKDVRARTRRSELSREDQDRIERETAIVSLQEATESGALILERLPGARAWILKDGVMADLVRIITSPEPA